MKPLSELFSSYTADAEASEFFGSVDDYTVKKSNINPNRYEIEVRPRRLIPKKIIRKTEADIAAAYGGKYTVSFSTAYPGELFDDAYLWDLIEDAELKCLVPPGFFSDFDILKEGERAYSVSVSFGQNGLDVMRRHDAEKRLSDVVRKEFGIDVAFTLTAAEDYGFSMPEDYMTEMEDIDRSCVRALEDYSRYLENSSAQTDEPDAQAGKTDAPALKQIRTVFDPNAVAVVEDGICSVGNHEFDISDPGQVFGDPFKIDPISISSIVSPMKDTVIVGTASDIVFDTRNRRNWFYSLTLFDGNASIEIRENQLTEEEAGKRARYFSEGKAYAVLGDVRKDMNTKEFQFVPKAARSIKALPRTDRSPEKRVELHLHTAMSQVDAMTQPADVIKTAMRWGYSSIAVTDHGNVQAFPEIMQFLDKFYKDSDVPEEDRFKPIYGMEAYFVNDTASPVDGDFEGGFDSPTVVFDTEATGLSVANSRIIEFGAVKLIGGKIVDRFSSFVNPHMPIPGEITELTGIKDSDVAGAPGIDEVLPQFLEFSAGCLLVAHNADYDTGLVRAEAERLGIRFSAPSLDTVSLSRFLNPSLSKHKLNILAEFYSLGDFNHHRAVDDAEMLAQIYLRMIGQLRAREIGDFRQLEEELSRSSDPKKLRSYHMIILVKDHTGLKNLYRMISESYLKYYYRNPRIPKTLLDRYREGLIIGSACSAGELFSAILDNRSEDDIESIAEYYDYLEVQPAGNDGYLISGDDARLSSVEDLHNITRRIVALGEKLGKPVVATSDSHFIDPEDEIYRRILQVGNKMKDADRVIPLYLRTTEEMLEEFSYLGPDKAREIVIENTNRIAGMIDRLRPIPEGNYPPHLDGANEELTGICWSNAKRLYGDPVPDIVKNRLEVELNSIISNKFAVLYVIAKRLVAFSEKEGYLVGSRGSVGSSFAASMAGISEVNPLPPHYRCPKCRYSDFSNPDRRGSGFDLPDAVCPVCGEKLEADGQDIPFETFLGFKGDKSPDIDLNFSGEVQGKVHKFTEELFGAENVFKAGTISTLADKTAFGYIMKYFEGKGVIPPKAEIERMKTRCMGVKKTTGQHPGGIIVVPREYEVYDFTPIQHPADDPKSEIITTHYAFSYLHDTILKLDELGHDIPTKYRYLEKYSGKSVLTVPMNDRSVYRLFESTDPLGIPQPDREDHTTRALGLTVGTLGIPEMGTQFIQQVLLDAKPKNFADLMQISGLTHGTNVWLGNAQDLINNGTCTISEVVGTRDGIMLDLIRYGLDKLVSFKIMEFVRKNKKGLPIPGEFLDAMREKNVPEWYIGSLEKIRYMFPKAHAAAYVMSAIRLAWYKVNEPTAFYSAIFTVAPEGFSGEIAVKGRNAVRNEILRIDKLGRDATQNEKNTASTLQLAHEAILRGINFLPVDLERSDAVEFLPEGRNIRLPFTAISGIGESAARAIVEARKAAPFFSVEDLKTRGKANKGAIDSLRACGALSKLSESDQLSVFDLL
jgi:DNA polymerase-3 subunit alpha (Gram-positive type)